MPFNSSIAGFFLILMLLATFVLDRWPDKTARLIVCDVGQGDAILVIEGFSQMLVDGGRDSQVLECLNRFLPFWDRQLEFVVATHPDADHIGGLATVLQAYEVQHLFVATKKETADFKLFWQAVTVESAQGMKIHQVSPGTSVKLGPLASSVVLSPPQDHAETLLSAQSGTNKEVVRNYNDESIVLFLQLGQAKVLLTGDLESSGEQALLNKGLLNNIDVLKVGHHGSKTSTTQAFVAKIQPEFSLISASKNNSYGHPHKEVVDRLLLSGSVIKSTSQEGHIELVATRQKFWFQ